MLPGLPFPVHRIVLSILMLSFWPSALAAMLRAAPARRIRQQFPSRRRHLNHVSAPARRRAVLAMLRSEPLSWIVNPRPAIADQCAGSRAGDQFAPPRNRNRTEPDNVAAGYCDPPKKKKKKKKNKKKTKQ